MMEGPNVVWYGDLFQEPITVRQKTGLFSSTRVTVGFRYHLGVQMALCRGPIDAIKRIIIGEAEVFNGTATSVIDINEPELFGGEDLGQGGVATTLDIYLGTPGQAVNAYLERFQDSGFGTTRTPNYTGTAYIVARELDGDPATGRGAYLGNTTQIRPWKFEVERYPGIFSGQSAGQHKINGTDSNPMNVIYEILTNVEWGFGFPAADIDVGVSSSFKEASDTLIAEENGFSMILDRKIEAHEFMREIERQIDGVVFLDHRTGKWTVKLVRADYDVDTVPQLTESNVKEVREFTRGSWEDTTNQLVVKFANRENEYRESFALAQDMANAMIQGGGTILTPTLVSSEVSYPGVKDPDLAAQVVWRDLRTLSYPLARATFIVNRQFWALTPGDVVAWTDSKFGFTKLPMRINRIDYGRLQQNEIELQCIQDVLADLDASYGFPPTTGWLNPISGELGAFPANEQLAFEAPRGIVVRDPLYDEEIPPQTMAKVMTAARRQFAEVGYTIAYSDPPGGPYTDIGDVIGMMFIGKLSSSLPTAAANPTATITIDADPDSQLHLEESFDDTASLLDIGQNLVHLVMVGTEFMLVTAAAVNGADVDLQNVYRGALDSAQVSHNAGDRVYLLFTGAALAEPTFSNAPNTFGVTLTMRSPINSFVGAVTEINVPIDFRTGRPYPPAAILYNGSGTPFTTPSLEGAGSGLNGFRIDVDWWRRNFETTNEVASLLADDTSTDASTEYELEVRADPLGANTLVGSISAWTTGSGTLQVLRSHIITAAAAGTLLRFILRARHDIPVGFITVPDVESLYEFRHDVTPSSSLTGQFYFGGGLNDGVSSASYTAAATGTFTLNIGAADTGNIEVNVAGGGFAVVIAAGLTTGTFAATSGNSIVVRRVATGSPDPQFVELKNPSSVSVAYGTFS